MPEFGLFLHMWVSGNLWCEKNFQEHLFSENIKYYLAFS